MNFRPGELVEVKGLRFRIAAINYNGKMILTPAGIPEDNADMMTRLQSTTAVTESDTTPQ